jgi:hypothetical protein
MDPGFDFRKTVNLGRMIERWGLVPIAYLSQFSNSKYQLRLHRQRGFHDVSGTAAGVIYPNR